MEIEISPYILWNLILTLILAPIGFLVRNALSELKRLDILINKTREEIAKEYVTKDQIERDMERLINSINRIDQKIDRLQRNTFFEE
jgi:hypothetical protein